MNARRIIQRQRYDPSNRSFLSLHFPWLSFILLLHNLATYAASTSRRTPTTIVDNERRTGKYLERSLRRYASSTLEFLNVVLISSTLRQGLKTAIARAFLLVESWLGNKTRDTIKFIPENERWVARISSFANWYSAGT